jgi:fatty-acyl-CoA synthase
MSAPTWSLNTQITMAEALRRVAEPRRGQEALVCDSARLTYGQLLDRSHALAQGLYGLGIRKTDRIATLLPPGPEFALTFFAVAELGAVIIPLNPQLRRRSLGATLRDAEPAALVTVDPVDRDVYGSIDGLRHIIFVEPGAGSEPWLAGLISSGQNGSMSLPDVSPEDLLALLYTSGTTGTPKGTMHSHRGLIAPVVASTKLRELWVRRLNLQKLGQMAKALARYRERLLHAAGRPQTMLSTTGWHTITGLGLMLQALLMGDRLVVMAHFHPRRALQWVQQERVTVLVAVPTAFQVMLGVEGFEQYDLSSLLICGTGSAPCPPHLAQEIQRHFHCALHIGFGATETAGGIAATSLADSDRRQAETVGRPMPGMEIKIVDEQRRELPAGQVGELACRSDSVMLGYYRAPEATAEVIDEQGWYYTGDLARMDEQGYVRIVGRIKDVIIRGGQNIYPAEIEAYLASHPKVREAAVVGVPTGVGGETAWAFVLLEDGAQMTEQEVLDYCRAELEPYKIPGRVRFVDDLPRSEGGKPMKGELRQAAMQPTDSARDGEGGKLP